MDNGQFDEPGRGLGAVTDRRVGLKAALVAAIAAAPAALIADAAKADGRGNKQPKRGGKGKADKGKGDGSGKGRKRPGHGATGPTGAGGNATGLDPAAATCQPRGTRCTSTAPCCAGLSCQGGTCSPTVAPGPTGTAGPQGPTGPVGPQGQGGPAGSQGQGGPAGPQGPTGQNLVGPPGPQGAAGPQGSQGPDGPQGSQGATGPAGGPTGPFGSVQYNKAGAFAGDDKLVWDYAGTGAQRLLVSNVGGSTTASILNVRAAAGQTGPLQIFTDDAGDELLRITTGGDSYSVAIGYRASEATATDGSFNAGDQTAVGGCALRQAVWAWDNTALGNRAMERLVYGSENTAVGSYALQNFSTGNPATAWSAGSNVVVGYSGGWSVSTGQRNILIGSFAGTSNGNPVPAWSITTGTKNIAIGYQAAVQDGSADNQLSIGNLIYGTGLGTTGPTVANGKIGIAEKAPAATLHVGTGGGQDGDVIVESLAGSGVQGVSVDNTGKLIFSAPSDARLKTAVEPLEAGLAAVAALNPVRYRWQDAARFGAQREVGFLAQEVRAVLPEAVRDTPGGDLSVDYTKLVAPLVKAVQELAPLRDEVADLRADNADLRAQLAALKARLES